MNDRRSMSSRSITSPAAAFERDVQARTARRQAFFVPSVFGVESHLLDLCDRLAAHMRLDFVSLPDAGTKGGVLTDMRATARGVVDEILRRQPEGQISLVGYSFGASVALEVATQLEAASRRIAFLGILDGPFRPPEVEGLGTPRRSAPRRIAKDVAVEATTVDGFRPPAGLSADVAGRDGPGKNPSPSDARCSGIFATRP